MNRVVLCALTSLLIAPIAERAGAATLPWAPPPVNSCGETGFDPRLRLPDPHASPGPPPPLVISYPMLELRPVHIPGPLPNTTRVPSPVLGPDPCANPCADPTTAHVPPPPPEATASAPPTQHAGSGSTLLHGLLGLPDIVLAPQTEPIPLPVIQLWPDHSRPHPPAPATVHPKTEAGPRTAALAAPTVHSVEPVSQLTGPGSANRTDVRWHVAGTDLGLMWESAPNQIAVMFGDTFDGRNRQGDWRSNVLGFSSDHDLAHGMRLDSMISDADCHAAEVLSSRKIRNFETTVIPTSGFAIDGRQYVSYMSVRRWSNRPGIWWTNYGGIAYSDDGGSTWVKDDNARWDNIFGTGKFQVSAMVPQGDYVYMFGTPNGRMGSIGLARAPKKDILNKTAYQYWVDGRWIAAAGNSADQVAPGVAGELSVRYVSSSGIWQMSYLDSARGVISLRQSRSPQGFWSDSTPLVDIVDYPQCYGGFIHPWSTEKDLYFTISEWDPYNVFLMHAVL